MCTGFPLPVLLYPDRRHLMVEKFLLSDTYLS